MCHSPPAWALDPHRALTQAYLRKWQFQQGLPQPTIFKIQQTSNGYIWLGTQSGLYRFDGIQFTAALEAGDASLNNLWIQDLCEDRNHNLWIATNDAGLVRLREGKAVSFGPAEGLPSLNVRCLLLARNGDLWIGTDQGLAHCAADAASQKLPDHVVISRVDPDAASFDVHALLEAPDETIWMGGDGNRLGIWNGSTMSIRTLASMPARGTVRALVEANDASVWIGTTAGLVHLSAADASGQERRFTRADGLPDDSIDCLIRSRDGNIWAGTRDGICRLQADEIESFRTRDGLSQSNGLDHLAEDHEGGRSGSER